MCRLYGLRASHPTQPACDLLEAQNALIEQSREDQRGLSNPDGWGLGLVSDGEVVCHRQVEPASKSRSFRTQALKARGTTVMAHVRRATIGTPARENTHPFRDEEGVLVHNGHIEAFESIQPWLLNVLPDERQAAIRGTTDSEHFFQLVRAQNDGMGGTSMLGVVRTAVRQVVSWSASINPEAEVALNTLWSEGTQLAGSRLNRSLWYLERDRPYLCSICGKRHAAPPSEADYRTIVFASERITDEEWTEVPNASAFMVTEDLDVVIEPLGL